MNLAHNLDDKQRSKDVVIEDNVSFESLLLPEYLLRGLSENGFRIPSPIQLKAVPLGRCGFDLIIKSKSGTGKTLVFSLVALEGVDVTRPDLQVLILVPTREIAVQIEGVLKTISQHINGLKIECFIGGLPLEDDIKKSKGCHIAVGAPGRVKHLISSKHLVINYVRLFVLDEADKLMEKSFQSDINEIFHSLPERKQLIASSATYPKELDVFLSKYMLSPTHVTAEVETPVLLGLKQFVNIINSSSNVVQMMKAKNESLIQILSKVPFTQCLVFSNYQTRSESVSNMLQQKGWASAFISAAQSQVKRLETVNDLKEFKCKILLSTDLTARGIDAANVDLVINYDIPHDAITYLHRMGRAGRYGAPGICINLTLPGDELKLLQNILGAIGSTKLSIPKLPDLNDNSIDLWTAETQKFEQIFGTLSENINNNNNDIKNEVMEFKKKQNKIENHKKKKKTNNNNKTNGDIVDLSMSFTPDMIMNILDNNKQLTNVQSIKSENIEINETPPTPKNEITENIKVESEKINFDISLDSIDVNLVANILNESKHIKMETTEASTSQDEKNKRKRESGESNSPNQQLHKEKQESCVGGPLHNLKQESSNQESPLNNFFQIAYDYAIDVEEKHWLEHFTDEEVEEFQQLCLGETVVLSDEEEECDFDEENEEDYEMGAEGGDAVMVHDRHVGNAHQQLNDAHSGDVDQNMAEHFERCYEDCSNTLWQSGLTFESVGDFDNWYYQWQEQLLNVRNYVQQNIYVHEMSKYQQNRFQM